jgi:hypothetical protein
VETGERVGAVALEQRCRQRGREEKKREGGGVRPQKCHTVWEGVVGPGPDRRVAPRPCLGQPRPGGDARAARCCSDSGALAPTGRASVAVRARRHGLRARTWAGPRRKQGGRAQMNSKVLHLFELV